MNGELNFAPNIQGVITSTRARYFEWTSVIGELIDNSFDAGANRVEIFVDGRTLIIEDDGDGCDDMERMLTMGLHQRRTTTRLGRYGVGLKDAAWWVGGPTTIETVHAGKLRSVVLDWDRMTGWSVPSPAPTPAGSRRGTRICFKSMNKERRFPSGDRLDAMLLELGFIYSPALKSGKQIVFRRGRGEPVLLRRCELPTLSDKIETTISVDGKTARVCAGIVPDGIDNPRPGLSYTHAFRVITHGALGCGGLGSARIAGWVALDEGWTLARNKDDVTAYRDELGEAVFEKIRPIVEKASRQALTLKSASLASDLTSMFRGIVGAEDARAKRERASRNSGGISPTGTGGKHKGARKTKKGTRFRELKAGHFRVDFKPCPEGAAGEVELDGRVIWLADNHPLVASARNEGDRRALLVLAVMLFSSRDCESGQPLLPFLRDGSVAKKIEIAAGRLLAEMHASEIADAAKAAA